MDVDTAVQKAWTVMIAKFPTVCDGTCSFWGPNGEVDWEVDAGQRWVLLAARERGACIFEAFSNSPPYWMTRVTSWMSPHLLHDHLYEAVVSFMLL